MAPFARFYWDDGLLAAALSVLLALFVVRLYDLHSFQISASFLPFLPLLVLAAITLSFSSHPEWARRESMQYLCVFLGYALARSLPAKKNSLLGILASASALYSGLVIFMSASGSAISTLEGEWILNTHVASAFALLGTFISWHLATRQGSKIMRICAFVNLAALIISRSWAGLAASGLGAGYILWKNLPPPWLGRAIKARPFLIVGLGLFGLLALLSKTPTLADRLDWWSAAAQMILQNPLTGAGPYEKLSPFYLSSYIRSPYAHNYALQFAAEYGIPAALYMLWLILGRIGRIDDEILAAGLGSAFAQNLFDFGLNIPGLLMLFFFVLALAEKGVDDTRILPFPKLASAALGTLLAAVAGWKLAVRPMEAFYALHQAQKAEAAGADPAPSLERAAGADPLRADIPAELCALAYERYKNSGSVEDLSGAIRHGRDALRKDPLRKIYAVRMRFLLSEIRGKGRDD